ncbi:MAG: hypothetical protein Q9184_006928 [Pyrenodesmia sp. 2 TL-2023]
MASYKDIREHVNISREKWEEKDGDGEPGQVAEWKLWDPSPEEAERALVQRGTDAPLSKYASGQFSHLIPRYVRLSDSGVGVVVRMNTTIQMRYTYYPLDFNCDGHPRLVRASMGNAWLSKVPIGVRLDILFSNRPTENTLTKPRLKVTASRASRNIRVVCLAGTIKPAGKRT